MQSGGFQAIFEDGPPGVEGETENGLGQEGWDSTNDGMGQMGLPLQSGPVGKN